MSAETKHYDVIRRPIVTEKSTLASESNAVVFEVAIDADKGSIRDAVEALFNVKVTKVNTLIQKGKRKVFRGRRGQRKDIKKAVVTLQDGAMIDVTTGL